MATRKRCPKGVSKTTGKCLKNKRPRKSAARKATARRGNCKKFGRSPTTGKCRKGPPVGRRRGGVDDSVRAAMRLANARVYG